MVRGTDGKKYPVIYVANQIKQHLTVLVSAAASNKSATQPPLPPPACGGE